MTESTELTTVERAEQALGFATLKPQLEALVKKSENIVTITNPAGRQECHAALMVLKTQRVAIEKTGKEAREEATRYGKAVIAAEKSLVDILTPEETRLAAIRQAWDDARAAEKAEEERIERERVQAMVDAIAAISAVPNRLFGATVDELTAAIDTLAERPMDDFDDVYLPNAEKAKADTIATLKEARDKRQALDDEAAAVAAAHEAQRIEREEAEAKLAAERAEFEAQQAAAREAQAKADEEARLAREEADREATEERARQQAELDAERAELARQREAAAAEQARRDQEAREQAEADAREAARREEEARAQEAQERAEEAARADQQHRENVRYEIAAEMVDRGHFLTTEDAVKLVEAIDRGEIENLAITF